MTQRTMFALLMLSISIVTLVSLYGWVTAVPVYQEPVAIPVVIEAESWPPNASPLLESPVVNGSDHNNKVEPSALIEKTDYSP
ncbi:MAG: hypothetical protein KDE56_10300 [Anaerolineales bacterium]|nr:hypothetical protein [Anaerolineales bacterium]